MSGISMGKSYEVYHRKPYKPSKDALNEGFNYNDFGFHVVEEDLSE